MATATRKLAVLIIILVGVFSTAVARERGPRVQVACPVPPAPVRVADRLVLAYELHVTNFDTVPLRLDRLEVFPDAVTHTPLRVVAGDAVSGLIFEVGTTMGQDKSSTTIAPGRRDVVFLWIELAADAPAPATLHHRIVFVPSAEANENTGPPAVLQDLPVPVSKHAPLVLSPPFDGGIWAGAGIGNNTPHRRSIFAIDGSIHQPERFAIDWVKVGPNGDSNHGTSKNEDFWDYGEPLYAVADGEVVQVGTGIADNAPRVLPQVTLDNILGNFVVLKIAPDRFVTYAHLKDGSIVVRPHQRVRRGDPIAQLGNSGNSTGPHLHFQVTDREPPLESEGVPFVFADFQFLGPGEQYPEKQVSVPRTRSLPENNAVVRFEKLKR